MPNDLLAKRLLTVFWFVSLSAIAFSVHGESATIFGKKGPYQVAISEVADQGLLLVPHAADGSDANKQWPGIVFSHGLCGPAKMYSESLERLCSWGFVVIANQQQEDCGCGEYSQSDRVDAGRRKIPLLCRFVGHGRQH